MASAEIEPFPPLHNGFSKPHVPQKERALRRRKSSTLGGELPGDSDVAALATLSKGSPPASPTELTVRLSARAEVMGGLRAGVKIVR
jgi:acyl-CoA-dependent ceramide synthase